MAQAVSQSHVSRAGTSRCSLSAGMNGSEDCIIALRCSFFLPNSAILMDSLTRGNKRISDD
jgi:hypothetical protein